MCIVHRLLYKEEGSEDLSNQMYNCYIRQELV